MINNKKKSLKDLKKAIYYEKEIVEIVVLFSLKLFIKEFFIFRFKLFSVLSPFAKFFKIKAWGIKVIVNKLKKIKFHLFSHKKRVENILLLLRIFLRILKYFGELNVFKLPVFNVGSLILIFYLFNSIFNDWIFINNDPTILLAFAFTVKVSKNPERITNFIDDEKLNKHYNIESNKRIQRNNKIIELAKDIAILFTETKVFKDIDYIINNELFNNFIGQYIQRYRNASLKINYINYLRMKNQILKGCFLIKYALLYFNTEYEDSDYIQLVYNTQEGQIIRVSILKYLPEFKGIFYRVSIFENNLIIYSNNYYLAVSSFNISNNNNPLVILTDSLNHRNFFMPIKKILINDKLISKSFFNFNSLDVQNDNSYNVLLAEALYYNINNKNNIQISKMNKNTRDHLKTVKNICNILNDNSTYFINGTIINSTTPVVIYNSTYHHCYNKIGCIKFSNNMSEKILIKEDLEIKCEVKVVRDELRFKNFIITDSDGVVKEKGSFLKIKHWNYNMVTINNLIDLLENDKLKDLPLIFFKMHFHNKTTICDNEFMLERYIEVETNKLIKNNEYSLISTYQIVETLNSEGKKIITLLQFNHLTGLIDRHVNIKTLFNKNILEDKEYFIKFNEKLNKRNLKFNDNIKIFFFIFSNIKNNFNEVYIDSDNLIYFSTQIFSYKGNSNINIKKLNNLKNIFKKLSPSYFPKIEFINNFTHEHSCLKLFSIIFYNINNKNNQIENIISNYNKLIESKKRGIVKSGYTNNLLLSEAIIVLKKDFLNQLRYIE